MHDARNHDAAGIGKRLQTRRHIDAVPENVIAIENDIADIDADAEFDALVRCNPGVTLGHATLDVDRTTDGVDHAHEFHEHSIARRFDDSAAMFGDLRINEFFTVRLELAQCAFLIGAHKPAIAGNVAGENRGQPAVHLVFGHKWLR